MNGKFGVCRYSVFAITVAILSLSTNAASAELGVKRYVLGESMKVLQDSSPELECFDMRSALTRRALAEPSRIAADYLVESQTIASDALCRASKPPTVGEIQSNAAQILFYNNVSQYIEIDFPFKDRHGEEELMSKLAGMIELKYGKRPQRILFDGNKPVSIAERKGYVLRLSEGRVEIDPVGRRRGPSKTVLRFVAENYDATREQRRLLVKKLSVAKGEEDMKKKVENTQVEIKRRLNDF